VTRTSLDGVRAHALEVGIRARELRVTRAAAIDDVARLAGLPIHRLLDAEQGRLGVEAAYRVLDAVRRLITPPPPPQETTCQATQDGTTKTDR
jgi:hypothetical protein